MSRYSTEQLKRGVVAPLHYNQSVVPSKNDYSSVASLLQSSTSPQNNHSQKQQQQQQQQLVLDDKSSSILTATTTTTSSSSSSAGSTNAGIETSFPRYRPDYSRAQHPVIPSHATIRTTAPSSMASSSFETSPLVTTNPSVNSLSPEQIRFEKYVNRFAAHDIRTSPLRRQKSPANTPVQSPANQSRLNSEKLSVTDRIQQFNKGGGSPKQHRLPLPQNQFSASPVRHNRKASVQSESIGKFSGVEQNCQMTNDADFTSTLTHTPCKNIAAVDIPSAKSSSPWSNRQATPRMPKVAATPTSATTMTNIPMSTSTSEQESLSSTQDRSEIPPPSLNRRIVPTRPLISDGPRSLSYDQPRNARQIEVQSPNRVADLRRKLWDNNETLQVAVPPSLHYVGGSNDDELDEDQPAVDSMSGPQRITPKMAFAALKGPEMAGRYGQRSRSLSPKRPPYVSTFKTRYYEAALASRRQAMARNELSPNVAAKSNQCSQETHDMKKRAQTKGQPYALASQENVDAESHHLHAQQSKQNKFQTGERSMQDTDPPRKVNPQQPNDYGPRKAHNFDSRTTESQIRTQQHHLQNQMVKSSTNKLISQPQQQQRQVVSTTTITSNDGNNNQASLAWRRQSMPSLVDERSDTTGDASVAKLVAKLNSINRDNPAEALAQIDSILKAESKSDSSDLNQGRRAYSPTSPVCVQEEKKDDCEHRDGDEEEDDEDDDDDDETSMSSITNPSYMHGPWGTHNSAQALLAGQSLRPNALQLYQQRPKTARIPHTSARSSQRATPPTTIQVKELPGPQGANQVRGHLEQLLTNDVSSESRNAAAIAMKIRMWDDLSASKSSVKLDEVNSIVPSLQEEIISATTDELGSIITPADHQMAESSASSHRESPLMMSALPTPQSSLLGAIDSLDVSGSEGQTNDRVSTGFLSPQFDVVVNSQQKENHPQRGRPLSRDDPPPPRNVSALSSLGSRRNHPWDHHHPRNRSASRDSNSNHDDLTLNHLSSIGDNDAHKLRPIDPAPVTSPRNALPVRRDGPVKAGQRSPARGTGDSSIVRSVLPFDSRGEADSRNDVNTANSGQVRSNQSNRVLATNPAEKVGDIMRSSNASSNSVQRATPERDSDGRNELEFKNGGTFEVDPKLLRENDDFGFPIRVKKTEDRVTLFSNEFDPAWEPQATDPFFPVNASTKVLVPQQRHSKSDRLTVRDVVRAGAGTPPTSKSSNTPPVSITQETENGDQRTRSPGRARFPMLKLKRSQDAVVPPPPPPPLKKQGGDSPSKPIKVVRFEHPQDTKSADTASSSATSLSKFGLLNLKKNRDGAGSNQAGKNSESDTDRSMVKTGGRQNAGSPSRERSGSFNIVQRFNRLMRERENLE